MGPYAAELAPNWDGPELRALLADLPQALQTGECLQDGRNRITRIIRSVNGRPLDLAVKSFGPSGWFRDIVGGGEGGKAVRSWRAALRLHAAGVGTPEPVALLERRKGRRLIESYLVTVFVDGVSSLREELNWIYHERPYSGELMTLLQTVADAVRALHHAGMIHYDLGNQNILLRREGPGRWSDVQFIDLNRARHRVAPTLRQRARDLSRLTLPGDFLRIFFEMVFAGAPPTTFLRWERYYRARFAWHTQTRRWRHPIRSRRNPPTPVYPLPRDIWIWDEYSGQAISAWTSRDRRRLHARRDGIRMLASLIRVAVPLRKSYTHFLREAYTRPVDLAARAGVAVQARPETEKWETELLRGLGLVPVLIRFYHHETETQWSYAAETVRRLRQDGHSVTVALVQDRRAIREPALWRAFMERVMEQVHDQVDAVEVGHAINRVKWGVWSMTEYRCWMAESALVMAQYPGMTWLGPAAIDFEYHRAIVALDQLPEDVIFSALSHHLYVDRRGAPENRQGRFATLEKAALARALAEVSPRCGSRLVITEVNWPLLGTGIYSPVGSPYIWPGREILAPNVSEREAAAYALRYLLITLCSGLAERVFWWQLTARGYGLTDVDRVRPAYDAYRLFTTRLGPSRFLQRAEPHEGLTTWTFEMADGERRVLVYAHPTPLAWRPPFTYKRVLDMCGEPITWQPGQIVTGEPLLFEGCKIATRN